MANQRKSKSKNEPKYFYQLADGTRYEIDTNENNELVTILKEMDKRDRLSERYAIEAHDPLFDYHQNQYHLYPSYFFDSPIDSIKDKHSSVEEILFPEPKTPILSDKVKPLVPLLKEGQQDLWYLLSEGYKIVDIAKKLNISPEAARSRIRKMHTKIKKLYQEKYGDL